jgi:hypothetical protein
MLLAGSASELALSPDLRFRDVIGGVNHRGWILLRETLQVVDRFGQQGILGGSLNVPQAPRSTAKATRETSTAGISSFVSKGMEAPPGPTVPPPRP